MLKWVYPSLNLPQWACGIQMELCKIIHVQYSISYTKSAHIYMIYQLPKQPWSHQLYHIIFYKMSKCNNYRLITVYLLLRVNLDKIMHACWNFDTSSARTRRVSALDKHQNWSASALFCLNSRAQSKYAVINLIHTRRKQTFLSIIMW